MSDLRRAPSRATAAGGAKDEAVVLHLPEGSGRFGTQALQTVRAGFDDAVRLVAPVLQVAGVDVAALDVPGMTIPGWGCGGYTYGPHTILLALDPEADGLTVDHVRATIVHEMHHVARERGPGCGTSLRERIVSEGLAMLFEEQMLGRASEFAHQDISDDDIALAVADLNEDPADDAGGSSMPGAYRCGSGTPSATGGLATTRPHRASKRQTLSTPQPPRSRPMLRTDQGSNVYRICRDGCICLLVNAA